MSPSGEQGGHIMTLLTSALQKSKKDYSRLIPWLVCISGGLLFFYEFIQTNIFGSINMPVMRTFGLNAHMLGVLSSAYFYSNAGFLFIAGNLLDRFSTRRLILFAMLACTFGTIGFAISNSFIEAFMFRFVVGIGGAFCFLSGVRLASRWFPPKRMALLTGILVTMAMIGGWVAQVPMSALLRMMPWRDAMLINGCLGIVLSTWVWFVVKDRPEGQEDLAVQEKQKLKAAGVIRSAVRVLSNIQNWKAALYACFLNLPVFLLGALWGSMYLVQIQHFSLTSATSITGMIFVGTIFGSPIMGIISDQLQNRKLPMIVGSILSLVLILILIYDTKLSYFQFLILFFAIGFTTSAQVIAYPVVAESNPHTLTATSASIICSMILLSGAITQPLSGKILDLGWHGKLCNGVHCYSLHAYQNAMMVLLGAFVLSLILAFRVKETHCKPYDQKPTNLSKKTK